jgi:hypothetical protein
MRAERGKRGIRMAGDVVGKVERVQAVHADKKDVLNLIATITVVAFVRRLGHGVERHRNERCSQG